MHRIRRAGRGRGDPARDGGAPVEAVRISLGGVLSRAEVRIALDYFAHVLEYDADVGAGFT